MKKPAPKYTKAELAATKMRAIAAKVTFLESELEVVRTRAEVAEEERDEQTEKWLAAVADRDALLAMLRSETGRAQAAVLVRLLMPVSKTAAEEIAQHDAMVLRWNEAMRRWEDGQVSNIEAVADAKIAAIEKHYDAQIAAIDRAQKKVKAALARTRSGR